MALSDYRNITLMATSQATKEVTVNSAINNLARGLAGRLVHDMASDADYTLSEANGEDENLYIEITDTGVVLTTTRNIIVPTDENGYLFYNNTAQSLVMKTAAGSGVTAVAGERLLMYCDGTNVVEIAGVSGFAMPFDAGVYAQGTLSNGEYILQYVFTRAVTFAAGWVGSQAYARVAHSDSPAPVYTLKKNGVGIGTITWSGSTGTFVDESSPATSVGFVAGDRITIEAPATADSTQADISITFKGTRTG